jgi:hypothetical protein
MPAPLRPCGLLVVLRVNWPITVTGRHAAGGAGVHEEAPRLTEQATFRAPVHYAGAGAGATPSCSRSSNRSKTSRAETIKPSSTTK